MVRPMHCRCGSLYDGAVPALAIIGSRRARHVRAAAS